MLVNTCELAQHLYGHHVIESVLEHGLKHQRQYVTTALRQDLLHNVWNRYSAYVIDKALLYGTKEDQEALVWDLLALSFEDMAAIASSQFGSMIMRTLIEVSAAAMEKFVECVQVPSARVQLAASRHGRKLCGASGVSLA